MHALLMEMEEIIRSMINAKTREMWNKFFDIGKEKLISDSAKLDPSPPSKYVALRSSFSR